MKRIAAIGDVHGCIEEFRELLGMLEWLSLDEIWCLGDLVDRGPDSGAVVQHCREEGIHSILGNHEHSILSLWKTYQRKPGYISKNADKHRTIQQLSQADIDWLSERPPIHVFDDIGLILVHGGIYPDYPLYAQPHNVIRAQMIHPFQPGVSRWWGKDAPHGKSKKTEAESRKEGFVRWYEVYDSNYDCAFGHSVFVQPFVYQREGKGRCIGIDTGSCFGGSVTAGLFGFDSLSFLSVKSKKIYYSLGRRLIPQE